MRSQPQQLPKEEADESQQIQQQQSPQPSQIDGTEKPTAVTDTEGDEGEVIDKPKDKDDDEEEEEEDEEEEEEVSKSIRTPVYSYKSSPFFRLLLLATHVFCLTVYLVPIGTHPFQTRVPGIGGAVLDELHIVSTDNKDVLGTSTLEEVFTNDYWGRPMNSPSSHKSWRPLTILSFRYLKGLYPRYQLFCHRLVNVVTHAATAECVSLLALRLFPTLPTFQTQLLRILAKTLFALHPTHVEVTANAANRPHLFAALLSVVLCDPQLHILEVMVIQLMGLLSSETFVFQMPAVVFTLLLVQYKKQKSLQQQQPSALFGPFLIAAIGDILPRVLALFVLSVSYLVMRFILDWLSIPEGLIRPAENPFYALQGWDRFRNYSYVVAIHVFKSWALDFVGFSHEYGFECIRQLRDVGDPRFGVVLLLAALLGYATHRSYRQFGPEGVLHLLFHLSWMATLFPISGIVKVGTFIADRITVASTVSVCILTARFLTTWLYPVENNNNNNSNDAAPSTTTTTTTTTITKKKTKGRYTKFLLLWVVFSTLWSRVHYRALEWMDSIPLLESSLKTCPRSAKSHLEISKVYSGLVAEKFDLAQSLHHLDRVSEIDPTYCDVHQQYAHVYVQQQELLKFEKRLTKAILCPFTMGGATEMWRRYWPVVTKDNPEAQRRMDKYSRYIDAAVQREQQQQQQPHDPGLEWGEL